MGRSQRHKVIEQGIASNGEIVAQGAANPEVIEAFMEKVGEGVQEATPILTELQPNTAAISDPDFTISCIGDNFTSNCKIIWMGTEEPTTLVGPNEVTTLVKPSVVSSPTTIEVLIRTEIRGTQIDSEPQTFTWTEAVEPPARRG